MNYAELIGTICAVLTVSGIIFKYAIVKPFENKIDDLSKLISELRSDLKFHDTRVRNLEISVAELEQRVRSNQHRIDSLEAVNHEKLGH